MEQNSLQSMEVNAADDLHECSLSADPSWPNHSHADHFYQTTDISKFSNCPIKAFLLCFWDNVVGPRIRFVWKSSDELLSRRVLEKVAVQTLNSEICRCATDPYIDAKFFSLPECDIKVSSFVFCATMNGTLRVHSLALLHSTTHSCSTLQALCLPGLERVITSLKVTLEKKDERFVHAMLSDEFSAQIELLHSLAESALHTQIPIVDTLFHWEHRGEREFISKAITSHLMSGGHSLVVGDTCSEVNLMVSTLAMFLPASERMLCRYVDRHKPYAINPQLCVQGTLHRFCGDSLADCLHSVSLSKYPTTLVDVSSRQVKISGYMHEHYLRKRSAFHRCLTAMWNETSSTCYTTSDMFYVWSDAETLVSDFMEEMDLLPPADTVKENLIDNFVKTIDRKAIALIEYVNSKTSCGSNCTNIKRHKVRQHLDLAVSADFQIVLASAEKLKAGICALLYQDRISECLFRHQTYQPPI